MVKKTISGSGFSGISASTTGALLATTIHPLRADKPDDEPFRKPE